MSASDEDEINMLKSFALLKQWLTECAGTVSWSTAEYRQQMRDNQLFNTPTFKLAWGDSFLLDQMFFRSGGGMVFRDYPAIPVDARVGDAVALRGEQHVITSAGLLTFDASRT